MVAFQLKKAAELKKFKADKLYQDENDDAHGNIS